jgi:FkbM family methyltransferase
VIASLLSCIPRDLQVTLVDVGSAGGLHKRWRPYRQHVSALLFEPRDDSEARQSGRDTIYPVALGEAEGRTRLNLTALANMSSVLQPNAARLDGFFKKGADSRIEATLDIPVHSLDAIAGREGQVIDALKIDVQGGELQVLRGATRCLDSTVILAEVEVSFLERYVGQPLAADILGFMADRGFELIELSGFKRYRRLNSFGIRNPGVPGGRPGRLAYCDALFLLSDERLLQRLRETPPDAASRTVMMAIVMLTAYGKVDLAAAMFDAAQSHVESPWRERLARWFGRLNRRRLVATAARRLRERLAASG